MSGAPAPPAVLVMAKAPYPGRAKTRLQPLLAAQGCARLQAELLQHTVTLATGHGLRTYVAYDPPGAREVMSDLLPAGMPLLPQRAGHLGQRMTAAVEHVFLFGPGPLLVIGTDAPTLTDGALDRALGTLRAGSDVVLGPALDGGYYLIGMRAAHTRLFGIDPALWSGPHVLDATLARAEEARLDVALLGKLRDLDTPEDAAALLTDPLLPSRIADLLTCEDVA